MIPTVTIYTDGACLGNPGPGGWAFIFEDDSKIASGFEKHTTNNRMELEAVIQALKRVPIGTLAEIITDSKYVIDGITKYLAKWKINGFKTSDKRPVKNQDLWAQLGDLDDELQVHYRWVQGHSGNELNERVDKLARAAAKEMGA